jgi:hypothetical protein
MTLGVVVLVLLKSIATSHQPEHIGQIGHRTTGDMGALITPNWRFSGFTRLEETVQTEQTAIHPYLASG